MIYTQRQLELLVKIHGKIVLPYRARLTPLAQDWVKAKKLAIGYADDQSVHPSSPSPGTPGEGRGEGSSSPLKTGGFVWWCDGPCGPSKAALISLEREVNLKLMDVPQHESSTVEAIKRIATSIKSNQIVGAILLVKSGAVAGVYANRCPSIRAINGTCIDAVDQGLRLVGANVLIIEHPYKSLSQTKTLATKFVKTAWTLSEETRRSLAEMSTCA